MIKASKAFLDEIDLKSEALKKSILESKTDITPVGKAIYISNDGNNENDGLTPETALADFDGLSKIELTPGDVIYLRRGDMWRIKNYTVKDGLTLSAYGKGAKPIITCSPMNAAKKELWTLLDGTKNVWVLEGEIADCGSIEFDSGIFAYKEIPSYVDGKFVLRSDVTSEFDVTKHLSCDLAFVQPNDRIKTDAGVPKMTNDNTGKLYLRCDRGNPAEVFSSIEFLCYRNALSMSKSTITIDNLCIKHCGAHGVGSGTCLELTVQNCEIGPLGGAIQCYDAKSGGVVRYGNGVEIYGACKDYTVKNCYVHDIYDAGVTHQSKSNYAATNVTLESSYVRPERQKESFHLEGALVMEDVKYIGNLFENCIYSIEYFCDQADGDNDIMRDFLIEDNICRFAGGWGWQRPNKAARHIQGGWLNLKRKYHAENYVVRNNIFDRSIDVLLSVSSTRECDLPKMEGNTYIQYAGGNFGMNGVPYDRYYPYDEATENGIIKGKCNEKDAMVYVVEE